MWTSWGQEEEEGSKGRRRTRVDVDRAENDEENGVDLRNSRGISTIAFASDHRSRGRSSGEGRQGRERARK